MIINRKTYRTTNKEFNESNRTITHYISTAGADEFGEILEPKGMDDSRFKAVLWSHSLGLSLLDDRIPPPSELVIGKSLWREVEDNGVVACTEFARTPLGNDVMRFNAEGYINSWSVGWKPKGANRLDEKSGITVYPKWYLYEYSSVIIPANPDAVNLMLKDAKSDGMRNILRRENEIANIVKDYGILKKDILDIRKELNEIKQRNTAISPGTNGSNNSKQLLINEALSRVMEEMVGRKSN